MNLPLRSPTSAAVTIALVIGSTALVVALQRPVLVLDIGDGWASVRVSEGDVLTLTYLHSMYDVPVSEKMRIEDGCFRLFHVSTENDAVIAFLGLENRDEHNVGRTIREFTIPAASVGRHVIRLHATDIELGTGEDRDGRIRLGILKMPYAQYLVRRWRI